MRSVQIQLEDARACLEAARFSGNHELADRLQGLILVAERETNEDNTRWLENAYVDREDRLVASHCDPTEDVQ